MSTWDPKTTTESDIDVLEREDVEESEPNMFKVIFHNDNVTTVGFVIAVLMTVFKKDENEAMDITLKVHEDGHGIAGIYAHETAEQKVMETVAAARAYSFPLEVTCEEDC